MSILSLAHKLVIAASKKVIQIDNIIMDTKEPVVLSKEYTDSLDDIFKKLNQMTLPADDYGKDK